MKTPKIKRNQKIRKIIISILVGLIIIVTGIISWRLIDEYINNNPITIVDNKPDDPRLERNETLPEGEWIVAPDEPRYMTIERLGIVNARVVGLGIKVGTENQLDDPNNIHDVGWYNESAKPGHEVVGNIAGLYDGHNTGYYKDGVFAYLNTLTVGDLIKIERGDGEVFNYEVHEVAMPLLEEIDMTLMRQSAIDGIEGLNIISCGGDWDESRGTYTHRVTIRATLK